MNDAVDKSFSFTTNVHVHTHDLISTPKTKFHRFLNRLPNLSYYSPFQTFRITRLSNPPHFEPLHLTLLTPPQSSHHLLRYLP